MQPGLPHHRERVRVLEPPAREVSFEVDDAVLRLKIAARTADSPGDPTCLSDPAGFWLALRTDDGPGTLLLRHFDDRLQACVWGDGAERLLTRVPDLIGQNDHGNNDFSIPRGDALQRALGREAERAGPLHWTLGRNGAAWATLQGVILGQRVTGKEAAIAHRRLVRRWSSPAPGVDGLWLPAAQGTLRTADVDELVHLGCDPRRAATLVSAARLRLDDLPRLSRTDAYRRLLSCRGIGPWSAAKVMFSSLGDSDAVWLEDVHLPHHVCWAFDGTARGSDERMLELLAPWHGHRARILRLVEQFVEAPPRFGARMPIQNYR